MREHRLTRLALCLILTSALAACLAEPDETERGAARLCTRVVDEDGRAESFCARLDPEVEPDESAPAAGGGRECSDWVPCPEVDLDCVSCRTRRCGTTTVEECIWHPET